MKPYRYTVYAFLLCLLTACATLGLPAPQSLEERIAYANGNVTGLVNSTTNLLNAKRIKVEDAKYVSTVAKESAALLDAAEDAATAGDAVTAEGRLRLAQSVLTSLEAYLTAKAR